MRILALLLPLAFAASLGAPAFAAEPGLVAVTGHGEIQASPDAAYVTSGVTSQGATAKAALDANTADMSKLIAVLKAAGIEAKDIQTSGFSVNPNYVYTDTRDANGYSLPPRISGYQVSNSVTVHVRDLGSLGSVLDQAVTVGANTINGINFAVEDPSAAYEEARKQAFADAEAKAALYAEAAESALGRVTSISEAQGYAPPPQPYLMKAQASSRDVGAPVPVEAGQLTFSIDVNVTWELAP